MLILVASDDIQIKELAERAMIHRKTFNLHYICIEALYEDILSELSEYYYKAIDKCLYNPTNLKLSD